MNLLTENPKDMMGTWSRALEPRAVWEGEGGAGSSRNLPHLRLTAANQLSGRQRSRSLTSDIHRLPNVAPGQPRNMLDEGQHHFHLNAAVRSRNAS